MTTAGASIPITRPEGMKYNFAHAMDNLHVRLTFNLAKTNKIFYYSLKEHPKISRIAKFGGEMLENMENMASQICKFVYICITREKSYHFSAEIVAEVVTFSSRNTNIYKFANFARQYFPCFTTFRHQTWQFY